MIQLARRLQQDQAAGRPVRGGIEQRVDNRAGQRRPRAVPDRVREAQDPTTPGHRPTAPAIAKPAVQHRPAQYGGALGRLDGGRQPEAGRSDHELRDGRS